MARFISLTWLGNPILVNVDHIVTVSTATYLGSDQARTSINLGGIGLQPYILVAEPYDTVVDRIDRACPERSEGATSNAR